MINEPQQVEPSMNYEHKIVLSVIVSVLISVIFFGGGIYLLQNKKLKTIEQNNKIKFTLLQKQIEILSGEIGSQPEIGIIETTEEEKYIDESDNQIHTVETVDTTNWNNVYLNTEAGFSFKYPDSVQSSEKAMPGTKSTMFAVQVEKITNLNAPANTPEQALAAREAFSQGRIYNDIGFGKYRTLIPLNAEINAQSQVTFAWFDVCDVVFDKFLIFYVDDYQVVITLMGSDKIRAENPQYFEVRKDYGCGDELIWKNGNTFYTDLLAGKLDGSAQEWFDTFEGIVDSLEIQ
jgi:hypothetical protein